MDKVEGKKYLLQSSEHIAVGKHNSSDSPYMCCPRSGLGNRIMSGRRKNKPSNNTGSHGMKSDSMSDTIERSQRRTEPYKNENNLEIN